MGWFHGRSLKRQYAYSNSPKIRLINRSPLQCKFRKTLQPTRYHVNNDGKFCWTGQRTLKSTEFLACINCIRKFNLLGHDTNACSIYNPLNLLVASYNCMLLQLYPDHLSFNTISPYLHNINAPNVF